MQTIQEFCEYKSTIDEHKNGSLQSRQQPQRPREKGLWNFLTWSFFISQVLVAEQFIGAGAKAAEGTDLAARDSSASLDPARSAAPNVEAASSAGDDIQNPQYASPLDSIFAQPLKLTGIDATTIELDTLDLGRADDPMLPVGAGSGFGVGGGSGGETLSGAIGAGGNEGGGGIDIPGGDSPAGVIPGVPDIVGGLVDTVGDVVGAVDNLLGTVVGTVDNLVGTLDHVLGDLLNPVTHLVRALEQPVEQILSVPSKLIDSLPVVQVAENVLGPVKGVLGSAGELAFPVVQLANLDSLFDAGKYTDYNIELQKLVPAAVATVDAATHAAGEVLSDVADVAKDVAHAIPNGHISDTIHTPVAALTGVLDEIGLRGLGDGIV
jgi:hypothetical protein